MNKLDETETIDFLTKAMKTKDNDTDKIIAEVQKNYRLQNNVSHRVERQLQYIEDKVNKILEILKFDDVKEIQKQQKIKQLEQELLKLKEV